MGIPIRTIIIGALFIPIMGAGYWLSYKGTPYNPALSVVHKLAAVASLFLINFTFFQLRKIVPLGGSEIAALVAVDILFVGAVATGALVSGDNPIPQAVHWAHRIVPWATIAASAVLLFLLNRSVGYAR